MTAYATPAQLAEWSGRAAPADAERLLVRASELLDGIVTAPFDLDAATELPSDPKKAAALRDAACAQVRFWHEVGEEHDIDGLAGSNVSLGGYSGARPPIVAPQARRLLKAARLL